VLREAGGSGSKPSALAACAAAFALHLVCGVYLLLHPTWF